VKYSTEQRALLYDTLIKSLPCRRTVEETFTENFLKVSFKALSE